MKNNLVQNLDHRDIKPKIVSSDMDEKLSNPIIEMKNSENKNIDFSNMTNEQLNMIMEQIQAQQKENERQNINEQPQKDSMTLALEEIREKIAEEEAKNEEQEAAFRVQEQLFEKLKTGRDIVTYPKISVSLDEFRREEAAKMNMYGKNSSFLDLFEDRIEKIPGEWTFGTITLFVTIQTGLIEENRTFGPFDVELPNLSRRDMYKLMVYTLLKNNFTLQSAQVITKIGAKVMVYNKQLLGEHYMEGVKLESHLLSKCGKIKSFGKDTCVPDYLWDQCKGRRGCRSYTREKFVAEVSSYATIDVMGRLKPVLCTDNIIQWAKECHPNVSIHAFDATCRKFVAYTSHCANITLVFIVKDHHLFPITDGKGQSRRSAKSVEIYD